MNTYILINVYNNLIRTFTALLSLVTRTLIESAT